MRILLVGSASQYAIEKPYLTYLKENPLVSCAELFPAQNLFLEYYRKGLIRKVLYRLGLSRILHKINHALLEKINDFKPDVVWVFKGMEVFPETLHALKSKGIKIANYNPDNPFLFTGRGSGNPNVTRSIGLYDLHFTYDATIRERLLNDYNIPVIDLPFGFDVADEIVEDAMAQPEVKRLCFIGNPDNDRASVLNSLAERGVTMDVFGNGWATFVNHKNINIQGAVFSNDLWLALSRYRIQLNLMRVHNPHSHNMRTFEVPGVGGILLAPDTADHHRFFEQDKEIFLYTDIDDCVKQINRILALTTEEARSVRRAARARSIRSKYRYSDRADTVAADFKKLFYG